MAKSVRGQANRVHQCLAAHHQNVQLRAVERLRLYLKRGRKIVHLKENGVPDRSKNDLPEHSEREFHYRRLREEEEEEENGVPDRSKNELPELSESEFHYRRLCIKGAKISKRCNADITPWKVSIKLMIQDELTKRADEEEEEEDEGDTEKDKIQPPVKVWRPDLGHIILLPRLWSRSQNMTIF
ncbi:uncharacterized protein LOC130771694 isoform X1 [Actinidia eriantha]|uniref:uncharacterized protein LOC130771694 isoform X1 n=1 Tax=Actinidia eriantha TaxID=165200 RepID=UPI00258FADD6|nr:uncharacterized protein LOC130771694 isoform X1 [Actinidia eriantha]